jgi:hypothetical protein
LSYNARINEQILAGDFFAAQREKGNSQNLSVACVC